MVLDADRFWGDLADLGMGDELGEGLRKCPGMDRVLAIAQDERGRADLAIVVAGGTRRIAGQSLQPGDTFLSPRLLELTDERPAQSGDSRSIAWNSGVLRKCSRPSLAPRSRISRAIVE